MALADLKTVVLRTPVNEWLDPMREAPSFEGASLVSETPPSGSHRGWGTLRVWVSAAGAGRLRGGVAESLERSYPWAVGFFFGNTELSLELWNIIPGISGFND